MLERIKTALVDSYGGAIAVGWLLSQGIYHFVTALSSPFTIWMQQRVQQQERQAYSSAFTVRPHIPFEFAIPQLLTALILLLAAYVLLYWLYMAPDKGRDSEQVATPEQDL